MAEGDGLLNRYTGSNPYLGFESLSLRFDFDNPRKPRGLFYFFIALSWRTFLFRREKTLQDRFDATPVPLVFARPLPRRAASETGAVAIVAVDLAPTWVLRAPSRKTLTNGAANSRSKRADRFSSLAADGWDTATIAGCSPILPK